VTNGGIDQSNIEGVRCFIAFRHRRWLFVGISAFNRSIVPTISKHCPFDAIRCDMIQTPMRARTHESRELEGGW